MTASLRRTRVLVARDLPYPNPRGAPELDVRHPETQGLVILLRAAGAERFVLDRIKLDDEAPLPGELQLLAAALDTLVVLFRVGER